MNLKSLRIVHIISKFDSNQGGPPKSVLSIMQAQNILGYNSKIITLFQKMDLLGNYTQAEWIINLNQLQLRKFLLELYDIWDYRSQLTIDTKLSICPPHGLPFREIPIHIIQRNYNINIDLLKKFCIIIIDKLINSSPIKDNQVLGAMYILSALTVVNQNAADAMPWLYQSVI